MPKKRIHVSKAQRQKVIEIINEFDEYLPSKYLEDVQNVLRKRNINVSDTKIYDVRRLRSFDISIAEAVKEVAIRHRQSEMVVNIPNSSKSIFGLEK